MRSATWRSKESKAEQLRLVLLAAVSGAAVLTTACAGRSVDDDDGGAGESSGATGGAGGSGNQVAGGGGTGGSPVAGSGGTPVAGSAGTAPVGRPPYGCQPSGLWSGSENLQSCEGGFVHRTSNAACPLPPRDSGDGGAGNEPVDAYNCTTDADCTQRPNGYCFEEYFPFPTGQCHYACESDADCGAGSVCSCEGYRHASDSQEVMLGRCVRATCSTDADCADGLLCISAFDNPICGGAHTSGFHCQRPDDSCSASADCGRGWLCAQNAGRFSCIKDPNAGSVCGRPFLVYGAARSAALTSACGWSHPTPLRVGSDLADEERARIAQHYLRAALMEHASIAAFARFSLQLLALGAPASLVEASAKAMADETRHARLCFDLAARYAGSPMAPGPLDMTGVLDHVDFAEVVRLAIDEGCIGESVAALEAHAAADLASEPSVKQILAEIAADETRHAELAFRFVAWAAAGDARVAGVVQSRLVALLAEDDVALDATEGAGTDALLAHGVLSAVMRRSVRSTTLRDVVIPALRALARSERAQPGAELRAS